MTEEKIASINADKIPLIKIFLSGEGGVGKTTLIERLISGKFNPNTILTIGVQHSLLDVTTPKGKKAKIQIWDLGGEERFKVIIPIYVKGSSGGIIAFDESRFSTFKNLPEWIKLIKKGINSDIPLILISTKADLVENSNITNEIMNDFIKENGIKEYFKTSAKSGLNIEEIFNRLVEILEEENII